MQPFGGQSSFGGGQTSHEGHHNPFMDCFKRVAENRQHVQGVADKAKLIVRFNHRQAEQLRQVIESQGTPVYVVSMGTKLLLTALASLGFQAGFIPPGQGKKYDLLVTLLKMVEQRPHCSFDNGVFVLTDPLFTVGFMAHQLHHWLSFRSGLPGYGDLEQKLYRVFWEKHGGAMEPETLEQMSEDQLMSLKHAINRDLEALQFIRQVTAEIFAPAQQSANLFAGGAFA
ncbi:MAG: hypothetical protein SFZ03_02970 [Candidatus Melainabacteria bacterium]|nr:hypothetical protein [Candidatus Melainabacteria bacterium]